MGAAAGAAGRGGRGRGGRGDGDADRRNAGGDLGADVIKLLKLIKQREIQPVIVFAFSRKCATVLCRVTPGAPTAEGGLARIG